MRPSTFAASIAALLCVLQACSDGEAGSSSSGGGAGVGATGGAAGSGVGGGTDSGAEAAPDSLADTATDTTTGDADVSAESDTGSGDVFAEDADSSLDSGSICAALDETQCTGVGIPCVALQGKLVQDGGSGYAGCWTGFWPTADGGWYPKDFAAIQSCAIDLTGACWVFSGAFAPDGWKLLPSCNNVPACSGALGDQ